MMLESFDQSLMDVEKNSVNGIRHSLNKSFDSGFDGESDVFMNNDSEGIDISLANWLGLDNPASNIDGIRDNRVSLYEIIDDMFNGHEIDDTGRRSLSLNEISQYSINPEYRTTNIRQQAGFAAEVISTARENMLANADGSGTRSFRADDLPDSVRQELRDLGDTYEYAARNDQFVDRIRIYADGTFERIQTKFVGSDASSCFQRLRSNDFARYFEATIDGSDNRIVDRLEIPRDYYEEIIESLIPNERTNLQQQLERVTEAGNTDAIESIQARLNRLDAIESTIEASTVTSREAIFARMHPRAYTAAMFARGTVVAGVREGLEGAAFTAAITAGVSTIDNYRLYMNGEISIEDALADIARDTGVAAAEGFIPDFITGSVNYAFQNSSHSLLRSLSAYHVPAMVISFGIDSYDEISDYAAGEITGLELAYELGDNAVQVLGATAGATALGPVPGGSLVGAVAGAALASKAYETAVELAVEYGPDAIERINEVADSFKTDASAMVSASIDQVVEGADAVRDAISEAVSEFPDSVADIGSELSEQIDSLSDAAVEQVQVGIEQIQEGSAIVSEIATDVIETTVEVAGEVGEQIQEGVEVTSERIDQLVDAAQSYGEQIIDYGNQAIEYVMENAPDQVDSLINSLNTFASENNLPFSW